MKKVVLITLLLMFLISTVVCAQIPEPSQLFYAADYANLLSEQTESFIIDNSNALKKATNAQVVVATMPDIGGKNERDYAIELARKWQIGGKENNGVLILVALEERKIDVEIGYGLEGALNDSKVGRFIDTYALPYLQQDDFDSGILNLYKAILNEVYTEYGLEAPENVAPAIVDENDDGSDAWPIILELIFFLIIIFALTGSSKRGGGNGGNGTGSSGSGGAFLGGFLLGSGSHHRGGGFGSGGFGGGGFRGGGGSFGGGGSSRGF